MGKRSEQIVAVDIGTSKVCVVVGRLQNGKVHVVGCGTHESRGLRKGQVVELDATADCLRAAIEDAELMSSCEITSAYVGISAGNQRGRHAEGMVNVHGDEVTGADVARVRDAARLPGPEPGQQFLHLLTHEYGLDAQVGISNPVGLSGSRLSMQGHLVSVSQTTLQTVGRCFAECGIGLDGMVLETLASSHAVLDPTEREMGVVLVDIGGGTTDLAIWSQGRLVHTASVPYGGDNVTRDVAIGLTTSSEHAGRLKERHGCALTELVDPKETIEVPGLMDRPSQRKYRRLLATIIEPRMDEIFRLVRREVELSGYVDAVRAGFVLTGGSAIMPGAIELAERTLYAPVRVGVPLGVGGLGEVVKQPKFSAAVGVVRYVADPTADVYRRVKTRSLTSRVRSGLLELIDRFL